MDYRKNKNINWSTLKYMKKSPLDYKMAKLFPFEGNEATKLGTFVHTGLLEPEKLEDSYIIAPEVKWRSKKDKEATCRAYAELLKSDNIDDLAALKRDDFIAGLNPYVIASGKELIPATGGHFNYEKGMKIIKENRNKTAFCRMWNEMEVVENALYAQCEVTGLALKGLVDITTTHSITDLKTIGTLGKMFYNIRALDYLGQVAFYDYLARLNGIFKKKFFIMFIETVSPYKMKILEIDPRVIAEQHEVNIGLLQQLKACIESDSFPDGSDQVEIYEYRGEGSESTMSERQWLDQSEGQDEL